MPCWLIARSVPKNPAQTPAIRTYARIGDCDAFSSSNPTARAAFVNTDGVAAPLGSVPTSGLPGTHPSSTRAPVVTTMRARQVHPKTGFRAIPMRRVQSGKPLLAEGTVMAAGEESTGWINAVRIRVGTTEHHSPPTPPDPGKCRSTGYPFYPLLWRVYTLTPERMPEPAGPMPWSSEKRSQAGQRHHSLMSAPWPTCRRPIREGGRGGLHKERNGQRVARSPRTSSNSVTSRSRSRRPQWLKLSKRPGAVVTGCSGPSRKSRHLDTSPTIRRATEHFVPFGPRSAMRCFSMSSIAAGTMGTPYTTGRRNRPPKVRRRNRFAWSDQGSADILNWTKRCSSGRKESTMPGKVPPPYPRPRSVSTRSAWSANSAPPSRRWPTSSAARSRRCATGQAGRA